jgi:hypothetical protein
LHPHLMLLNMPSNIKTKTEKAICTKATL